jgi:hypothetical protein
MKKLQTQPFDSGECLNDIINRLEGLTKVCDGRKMDERQANEFAMMIHELGIVRKEIRK